MMSMISRSGEIARGLGFKSPSDTADHGLTRAFLEATEVFRAKRQVTAMGIRIEVT